MPQCLFLGCTKTAALSRWCNRHACRTKKCIKEKYKGNWCASHYDEGTKDENLKRKTNRERDKKLNGNKTLKKKKKKKNKLNNAKKLNGDKHLRVLEISSIPNAGSGVVAVHKLLTGSIYLFRPDGKFQCKKNPECTANVVFGGDGFSIDMYPSNGIHWLNHIDICSGGQMKFLITPSEKEGGKPRKNMKTAAYCYSCDEEINLMAEYRYIPPGSMKQGTFVPDDLASFANDRAWTKGLEEEDYNDQTHLNHGSIVIVAVLVGGGTRLLPGIKFNRDVEAGDEIFLTYSHPYWNVL